MAEREYIPFRYSQHRTKYQATPCVLPSVLTMRLSEAALRTHVKDSCLLPTPCGRCTCFASAAVTRRWLKLLKRHWSCRHPKWVANEWGFNPCNDKGRWRGDPGELIPGRDPVDCGWSGVDDLIDRAAHMHTASEGGRYATENDTLGAFVTRDHYGYPRGTYENRQDSEEILAAIKNEKNWKLSANVDGGVLGTCAAIPKVDLQHECPATTAAPNMWDLEHKLYTVFVLDEDNAPPRRTFPLGCVDAEFPHFPVAHHAVFSAFPLGTLCARHALWHAAGLVVRGGQAQLATRPGEPERRVSHCYVQVKNSTAGWTAGLGTSRRCLASRRKPAWRAGARACRTRRGQLMRARATRL